MTHSFLVIHCQWQSCSAWVPVVLAPALYLLLGLIPSSNPGQIDFQVKWLDQLAVLLSFQVSSERKKSMHKIYLSFSPIS